MVVTRMKSLKDFLNRLKKYEENLQEKMKGSEFEFDGVDFLYYDFNKISINSGG